MNSKAENMDKYVYIPLAITLLAVGIFIWVAQIMGAVWVFVPAAIITFLIYLITLYKHMPSPSDILPLYLLALAIQMLHFAEEYIMNFTTAMPALLGQEPYPNDYWLVFNMAAYFVFILGGIALFKKRKEYAIIPLFFILAGVLLNGMAHIALSIYSGAYFPGMITAILYLVIGPVLLKRIFNNTV